MTPRLSNRYGAPTEIVEAVKAHPYDKGEADFSATELIKPPQLVRLYRQHEHEITLDVRDEMWKLLGSGVHAVLEMAGRSLGREPEDRLFATVESSRGEVKIASGQPDLIHNGVITDYKVTSVYAIQDGGRDEGSSR